MNTQKNQTTLVQASQTNRRRWLFLGTGIFLVGSALLLAALWFKPLRPTTNLSAAVVTNTDSTSQQANSAPQSASVRTNVAEHEAELANKPGAPAQDPAVKSVQEYILAHNGIPTGVLFQDPAVKGVMEYIRVHNSIPDGTAWGDPRANSR